MSYVISLFLEGCVRYRKNYLKQNVSTFLAVTMILFMAFIGGKNSNNPDYKVYESLFLDRFPGNYSITEPVYVFFNQVAHCTGVPFQVFFAMQVIISLVLMNIAFTYFTKNVDIVWGYYMIFPFAINIVQIRYMLATSIVIYAFIYLHKFHESHKYKMLLYYIVLVFLAGLIHFSTLVFIVFAVPEIVFKKDYDGFFLGIIGATVLSNVKFFGSYFASIIGERKANNWLSVSESFSINHIVLIIFLRVLVFLTVYLLIYFDSVESAEKEQMLLKHPYNLIIYSFNSDVTSKWLYNLIVFMMLTFIPLELFTQQFSRLTRVYLILIYMFFAKTHKKKRKDNEIIVSLIMDISILIIAIYEYSRGANSGNAMWNTVLRTVFENRTISG